MRSFETGLIAGSAGSLRERTSVVSNRGDDADAVQAGADSVEARVMESMWSSFWEPEISRRGGVEVTGP